ncbi:TetR/AcrR family transcriptional regulator [Kineococcus sp. SYSU DK002]|uniref:TetR/AcrR family transcriptional regulator n=1 Tax=Kineococcus sp. SYSU DK002 TaxID=3383123 RepID=UPI003D7F182C
MSSSQLPVRAAGNLRSDAGRNRAEIVSAARAVFTEAGTDVPTSRIARRAGVAVATLYRRFPTREALVEAAFADQHADCSRFFSVVEQHPEPWPALRTALRRFCAEQARDKGFTAHLLAACLQGRAPAGAAATSALEAERLTALVRRARDSGAMRPDVGLTELHLLVAGNAGVVAASPPDQAAAASRRFVELFLRSLEVPRRSGAGDGVR